MSNLARNTLIGILLLLITLVALFWLGAAPLASYLLERHAEANGARFSAARIRLNPLHSAIEVEDAKIVRAGETHLSVQSLVVKLRLPDLLDRRFHLNDIQARDVKLVIEQQDTGWTVGGLTVAASTAETEWDRWRLVVPAVDVQGSAVELRRPAQTDRLDIRRLQAGKLEIGQDGVSGSVDFLGQLNNAPLSLQGDLSGQKNNLEIFADVALSDFPLERVVDLLPQHWLGSTGNIKLTGKSYIHWVEDAWVFELVNTDLALQAAHLLHPPLKVDSEQLSFTSPALEIRVRSGELTKLKGSYRVESGATRIYHRNEQRLLAQWDVLGTQSGEIDFGESAELRLPEAVFTGLTLSHQQFENDPLPALLHAKQLTIQGLHRQGTHTAIETAAFSDVDTHLVLSQEREPLNALRLAQIFSAAETPAASAPAARAERQSVATEISEPASTFNLNRLDISGTNTLTLVDRGTQPTFVRTLVVDSFHLDKLDTREPSQPSFFELRGSADGYASFHAEGMVKPFTEQLNLQLTATLREADLPSLSAYVRSALDYEFRTGQLDLNLNMTITDGQIAGQSRINLRGAELRPLAKDEASGSRGPSIIPLNLALSMIEDDQGNVELEIPLSGDIQNPSFELNGYIARKLGAAILRDASSFAMQALVPYTAVITIAQIASDHMLKMRFKPLELEPGQLPGEAHAEYMSQFNQLLLDRDDLMVTVCGVATPADLQLAPGTQDLTEAQRQQLTQLAEQRASSFKEQAIKRSQIASSRLLTCNAGIDFSRNAKPRVDLDS